MNLIALLIGLIVERLATQLFHLRRLRWLDRVIDTGFRAAERTGSAPPLLAVCVLAGLLALPVLVVILIFGDTLGGFPYLLLAIAVLFFSFGPQDIGEDVDQYCRALEDGDGERIRQTAKAIVESDVPDEPLERIHRVEESVFVQANNRLFAVIFWFVAFSVVFWFAWLGPLGAWSYRATDLIRRRAVFSAARGEAAAPASAAVCDAALTLHGWFAWLPARLTAIGYAVAGHFDAALGAWRAPSEESGKPLHEYNERLLARVGTHALALQDEDDEDLLARGVRGATAANRLVFRLLLIWAVIIAAMTLYGLTQ